MTDLPAVRDASQAKCALVLNVVRYPTTGKASTNYLVPCNARMTPFDSPLAQDSPRLVCTCDNTRQYKRGRQKLARKYAPEL